MLQFTSINIKYCTKPYLEITISGKISSNDFCGSSFTRKSPSTGIICMWRDINFYLIFVKKRYMISLCTISGNREGWVHTVTNGNVGLVEFLLMATSLPLSLCCVDSPYTHSPFHNSKSAPKVCLKLHVLKLRLHNGFDSPMTNEWCLPNPVIYCERSQNWSIWCSVGPCYCLISV